MMINREIENTSPSENLHKLLKHYSVIIQDNIGKKLIPYTCKPDNIDTINKAFNSNNIHRITKIVLSISSTVADWIDLEAASNILQTALLTPLTTAVYEHGFFKNKTVACGYQLAQAQNALSIRILNDKTYSYLNLQKLLIDGTNLIIKNRRLIPVPQSYIPPYLNQIHKAFARKDFSRITRMVMDVSEKVGLYIDLHKGIDLITQAINAPLSKQIYLHGLFTINKQITCGEKLLKVSKILSRREKQIAEREEARRYVHQI